MTLLRFKDQDLDQLSTYANIAQFVSFSDKGEQRFSNIYGFSKNHRFCSIEGAVSCLMDASVENSVNIRSFYPDQPQSCAFIHNVRDCGTAIRHIENLLLNGLFVIVNEMIPFDDGGISGAILQYGKVEMTVGEGSRFVEESKYPIATFDKSTASRLISMVYGIEPDIDYPNDKRVEFSVHPKPSGCKRSHTVIWEIETLADSDLHSIEERHIWPSKLSMFLGDKTYGLLMAQLYGFRVPHTTVYLRDKQVQPFSFGTRTSTGGVWTRTCPKVQEPGKFTTVRGFRDPYLLMDEDDPSGKQISACLHQHEIPAVYSGAAITTNEGLIVEGIAGFGDVFMLGGQPITLPRNVETEVCLLNSKLQNVFGPVRFEWVYDGHRIWIVQLHIGTSVSSKRVIYPGKTSKEIVFNIRDGFSYLRELISTLDKDTSIVVAGNVGMSSHIADLLRKEQIPSRLR